MMNNAELLAALRAQVMEVQEITYPKLLSAPGSAEGKSFRDAWLHVQCPASKWTDLARALKETPSLDFDLLNMVTAVDYFKPLAGEPHFDLVYQFLSFRHRHKLVVKITVPRENASVASVVPFWSTADWQEREVYDMYGVRFDGHPNCTRILMWDGFPGWPLRKDFVHIPDRYDD